MDFKTALEKLQSETKQKEEAKAISNSIQQLKEGCDYNSFWHHFQTACQPQSPVKLRETAIDLIQKLMVRRIYFKLDAPFENHKLIDQIIHT